MGNREVKPIVEIENTPLAAIQLEIAQLVQKYLEAKGHEELAVAVKKDVGQELQAFVVIAGTDKVGVNSEYYIHRMRGASGGKLSETKLMERGVDPDIISECWEGGKEYWYVQIRKRTGGDTVEQ